MFLNDETTKAQLNEIFATTKTQYTDTHEVSYTKDPSSTEINRVVVVVTAG